MENRIYKGDVTSIVEISTDTMGIRTYLIGFRGDKKVVYQRSTKSSMPISVGHNMYFTGSTFKGFFIINKIIYNSMDYELQIEAEKQELYHQEMMNKIKATENLDGLSLIPS